MLRWGSFLGLWGDFGVRVSRGRSPSLPSAPCELRAPLNQTLGVSPQKNNSACEFPAPVSGAGDAHRLINACFNEEPAVTSNKTPPSRARCPLPPPVSLLAGEL